MSEDEFCLTQLCKRRKRTDGKIDPNNPSQKPGKVGVEIYEVDYVPDEPVVISDDVYNLTIAANMTKQCSP